MKTIVYHVVTERPMTLGQQILMDENHPNGVCRRVRAYGMLLQSEEWLNSYRVVTV